MFGASQERLPNFTDMRVFPKKISSFKLYLLNFLLEVIHVNLQTGQGKEEGSLSMFICG